MRVVITTLAALTLASCAFYAPRAESVGTSETGEERFHVSCFNGLGGCYRKAAKICPNGYTVIDSGQRALPQSSSTTCTGSGNQSNCQTTPDWGPSTKADLIVDCSGVETAAVPQQDEPRPKPQHVKPTAVDLDEE